MSNTEIGSRIKQTRVEKGLSLEDVAKKVGVAKSTIQRYEAGAIEKIKLPVIESIAKELKVNSAWLLGKEEDKYGISDESEIEYIVSALQQRPELRELFSVAVSAAPSQVDKAIKIFEALIG